jgi:excisionase family DNA binding protein
MIDAAPLLTYRECAEVLHVSLSTARRLGRSGHLEVVRLTPQTHRIRPSSLLRLIESGGSYPDEMQEVTAC